ncbi:hypothetical protein JTB14_035726 [Gonioctena quinquepunctata]|nr:hypothetical protein JTB14_035726 [Gonioctena quinquepunctata]
MRLDHHELGLESCNERLDDIDRKNLGMLKEVQRNILLETKTIVKTAEEALKSELDKTMLNLKNQLTNYRDRINHEVLDKLHGMDERIKVFEADLAAQVKILKAKDDAIESRLKILEDLLIPEVEILDS